MHHLIQNWLGALSELGHTIQRGYAINSNVAVPDKMENHSTIQMLLFFWYNREPAKVEGFTLVSVVLKNQYTRTKVIFSVSNHQEYIMTFGTGIITTNKQSLFRTKCKLTPTLPFTVIPENSFQIPATIQVYLSNIHSLTPKNQH